jgi:hypothetical protein
MKNKFRDGITIVPGGIGSDYQTNGGMTEEVHTGMFNIVEIASRWNLVSVMCFIAYIY